MFKETGIKGIYRRARAPAPLGAMLCYTMRNVRITTHRVILLPRPPWAARFSCCRALPAIYLKQVPYTMCQLATYDWVRWRKRRTQPDFSGFSFPAKVC